MINRIKKSISKPVPTYNRIAPFVQQGLAVTPRQMDELTQHGVPVSTSTATEFYDGDSSNSMYIELARMRGVDVVDAWNAEMSSKKNLLRARDNDISNFS